MRVPDGGATVYARSVDGKGERVLIEQPKFSRLVFE